MGIDFDEKSAELTRRQFVMAGGALTLAGFFSRSTLAAAPGSRIPALQTWAADDRAEVTVLAEAGWRFQISSGSGSVNVRQVLEHPGRRERLYHLSLQGLSTQDHSVLQFWDSQGRLRDERRIKGLDPALRNPTIALMSCTSHRHLKDQERLWARVPEVAPDLILFCGDLVYANSRISSVTRTPETPQKALDGYLATWKQVGLYALDPLVPTLTVWDDHDYGMNNGDATHPYRTEMWKMFRSFYPLPFDSTEISKGPGVAFRASLFGIDFYMMDGRSFAVPGESVWGPDQHRWFAADYAARPFPAWLLNGTCFLKHSPWIESVEKYASPSLNTLGASLRDMKKAVILISGDIHASQVQKVAPWRFGFPTYEITSSAVQSSSAHVLHWRGQGKGQIFYEGGPNFMTLRVHVAEPQEMRLGAGCATPGGLRNHPEELVIKSATTNSV